MIVCMMRVKNEARWIREVVKAAKQACSRVFVFDDHSTDDTFDLAADAGAEVTRSQFEGLDEARDKNFLLAWVKAMCKPDWVLSIDGDELLTLLGSSVIGPVTQNAEGVAALSLRVRYLWNDMHHVRVDGVYGTFWRPSLFRLSGQPIEINFRPTSAGGNFHCGNVPHGLVGHFHKLDADLLHLGYMHREDRIRKYEWYNAMDPHNELEDRYRHIVQGDIPEVPSDARLKHAGPLRLEVL